jgi:hypothetical protein
VVSIWAGRPLVDQGRSHFSGTHDHQANKKARKKKDRSPIFSLGGKKTASEAGPGIVDSCGRHGPRRGPRRLLRDAHGWITSYLNTNVSSLRMRLQTRSRDGLESTNKKEEEKKKNH